MKLFLKVAGGLLAVLLLTVVAAYLVGAGLPRDHVVASEALISAEPAKVAARIGDPTGYDAWRDTHTEVLSRSDKAIFYREHAMGDFVDYRIVSSADGRQFTSTILSKDLPFGGSWMISVLPHGTGSRVRVMEHGFVSAPLWRFGARYIFGQTMAIDGYLAELQASFENPERAARPDTT